MPPMKQSSRKLKSSQSLAPLLPLKSPNSPYTNATPNVQGRGSRRFQGGRESGVGRRESVKGHSQPLQLQLIVNFCHSLEKEMGMGMGMGMVGKDIPKTLLETGAARAVLILVLGPGHRHYHSAIQLRQRSDKQKYCTKNTSWSYSHLYPFTANTK
uniref:HDC16133 n=1 Tax=Drosophila melanogaster TaxID=7227 RepID=Q6IJ16_DROME|nr:TPA_inf: HDC16133 [Drosophila melanogaster]